MIYVEKSRTAGQVTQIAHATLITTLMVALQCGKVARLEAINSKLQDNDSDDDVNDEKPMCIMQTVCYVSTPGYVLHWTLILQKS